MLWDYLVTQIPLNCKEDKNKRSIAIIKGATFRHKNPDHSLVRLSKIATSGDLFTGQQLTGGIGNGGSETGEVDSFFLKGPELVGRLPGECWRELHCDVPPAHGDSSAGVARARVQPVVAARHLADSHAGKYKQRVAN